jgi:ubiquinone/menaquinone biosynthesis C-methylase UbiE
MNPLNRDDNSSRQEQYTFSEDGAFTRKLHASRTATRQAAFFLPYLHAGMRVLDCGSGSGSITVGLAQILAPGEVIGIDASEVEVTRSRERAVSEGIANVRFEVGNVYDLAFPTESFDALFSHNVLEHVGEPIKALREMVRVLRPGGVIGIRDADMGGTLLYASNGLVSQYKSLHEAVWKKAGGDPWMARRLRGLLHEAGFVDVAASASFDVYGDVEGLRLLSQTVVSRFGEADFVRQIVEYGLVDAERVEEMKAAWRVWPEDPAAFGAVAHCEVVGRKSG